MSSPPRSIPLTRTLSHTDMAHHLAIPYKEICKEGDTILINYFMNAQRRIVEACSYVQKVNGEFVEYTLYDLSYQAFSKMNWTHCSGIFPPLLQ